MRLKNRGEIMHILHIPLSLPRYSHKPSGTYIIDLVNLLNNHSLNSGLIFVQQRRIKKKNKFPFLYFTKGKYDEVVFGKKQINLKWKNKFFLIPTNKRNKDSKWQKYMFELFQEYIGEYGKPDLLHCHSGRGAGELALKINDKYSIPYIVMEHNPIYLTGNISSGEKKRLKKVYNKAAKICPVSNQMNKTIKPLVNADKIKVVPNFVSKIYEKPIEDPEIKSNKNHLLTIVSRLDDNKNVSMGIKAFNLFQKEFPNSKLEIFGKGDKEKDLKNLTNQLNLSGKVKFHGFKQKEVICQYLTKSKILLQCSYNESFGVPIIEALARGCFVVATKSGGPEEISKNVEGIKLVEKDDHVEMSKKMKEIIISGFDLKKIKWIRRNMLNIYGRENVAEEWLGIYRDIINNRVE
ncbi:glycosyltransferase [Halarsenatibacter silvermanii]|nr:glycosyltransferase [Halarsenatibacter silvermanii]